MTVGVRIKDFVASKSRKQQETLKLDLNKMAFSVVFMDISRTDGKTAV